MISQRRYVVVLVANVPKIRIAAGCSFGRLDTLTELYLVFCICNHVKT